MTRDQAARVCVAEPRLRAAGAAEPEPGGGPPARWWTADRAVGYTLTTLWAAAVLLWELVLPFGTHVIALLVVTPALACVCSAGRSGVWFGGGCAFLCLFPPGRVPAYEWLDGKTGLSVAILVVVVLCNYALGRKSRLADELARSRETATAAQQALIRPLPPRIEGFTVAAGYLSSARGAVVGGDLYDAAATAHGVRVLIGDVRGHGLGAVSTVAAVLGGFREAVHDEPRLEWVAHRLERALVRHLEAVTSAGDTGGLTTGSTPDGTAVAVAPGRPEPVDEEFVTALLLELRPDGTVTAVNCGHPWPYRLTARSSGGTRSEPVSTAEPLPPLGMVPLPPEGPERHVFRLAPGEGLLLYTDGAEDARDADGRYFPLRETLMAMRPLRPLRRPRPDGQAAHPADVVDSVRRGLLRHARGELPDDVALLALRNDCCPVHGHGYGFGHAAEHGPRPEAAVCSCP